MTSDPAIAEHERLREALALDLYDELDSGERAALEEHLGGCADCRALRDELAAGLGRLAPGQGAGDDLPAGWLEALRGAAAASGSPAPVRPLALPLLAAFAAGLLVALLWTSPARIPARLPAPAPGPVAGAPAAVATFEAEGRPPPAWRRSRPAWLAAALAR